MFRVDPPLDEAVARALAALLDKKPASVGGAWREAALCEGVELSEQEPGYALSPRSTRGATRA
jgi:hypothetical protein